MRIVIADDTSGQLGDLARQVKVAGLAVGRDDQLALAGNLASDRTTVENRLSPAPDLLLLHWTALGGSPEGVTKWLRDLALSQTLTVLYSGGGSPVAEACPGLTDTWTCKYEVLHDKLAPFLEVVNDQGLLGADWPGNVTPALLNEASWQGIAARHVLAICRPLAAVAMGGGEWGPDLDGGLWAAQEGLIAALRHIGLPDASEPRDSDSADLLHAAIFGRLSDTAVRRAWADFLDDLKTRLQTIDTDDAIQIVREVEQALYRTVTGL